MNILLSVFLVIANVTNHDLYPSSVLLLHKKCIENLNLSRRSCSSRALQYIVFYFLSLNLRTTLHVRFLINCSEKKQVGKVKTLVILCWWFNICKLLCKFFHTYWLYWKSNQASNTRERVGKQVEEVNFCFSSYPPAPGKQPSHGATHKLYYSVFEFFF